MKFDNPIKEILQDAMPALLRLLGLPEAVKYLTVELPRPNRVVPDMVIELASQAILHLESQSRNQADFAWRCLDYYSAIHQLFHPPKIIQVLVYLGSERLSMPNRINDEDLTFKYRVLNLAEVPAEVFLDSPSNLERILAVLGRSEDPRETIRQILSGWKHLPRKQIEELMARLSVLSQLRKYDTIAREEIERMPHPRPLSGS